MTDPTQPEPRPVTEVGEVRRTSQLDIIWEEASAKYLVDQAAKIREAASKWGTSATAILAVAGLATAFEGRETLSAIAAGSRDGIASAVIAAIVLAGVALFFAALATTGSTEWTWNDPTSFRLSQSNAAAKAARWLELSKWGVALAFAAAVIAVAMVWTAPKVAPDASNTLVIGPQGDVLCGELEVDGGQLVVDDQPLPQPPISVHTVPDCPE